LLGKNSYIGRFTNKNFEAAASSEASQNSKVNEFYARNTYVYMLYVGISENEVMTALTTPQDKN